LHAKQRTPACRDSLADTESTTPTQGVADFDQNGWPLCVRTGGRLAPDSLAALDRITHHRLRGSEPYQVVLGRCVRV